MLNNIPIILLHGLGAHPITLWPMELYLRYKGWENIHRLSYPIDTLPFDQVLDYVDRELEKVCDKKEEIILIGQSMGGVIANNLHKKGWIVRQAIYIGSPLHGANLLNQLERILPTKIRDYLYKLPYDYLKAKALGEYKEEEPPHSYKTISMGWGSLDFDGCVYRQETMLNEKNHIHLKWADHRTIFANPRLWIHVERLLN